jgi:hypothetical protein
MPEIQTAYLARWVQENRPNARPGVDIRVPRLSEPYSNGSLSEPFNYEDLRNQIRCLLT